MFGLSGTSGKIDAGDFEEFGVWSAVAFVLASALEEAWDETLSELIFVTAAGVADSDGGYVACRLEDFSLVFADEGECERFEESAGREVTADDIKNTFASGACCGDDRERGVCGDVMVAVNAGDFFDEVNFAGKVESPAGWLQGGGFGGLSDALESELLEDTEAGIGGYINPQQFIDSFEAQSNRFAEWGEW
ncbi:MAG: hypothetical protein RLZZ458_349 [Planctomycetota bacterium]